MRLTVEKTPLPDLLLVDQEPFDDERGYFMELFRKDLFMEAGLPGSFEQVNQSGSVRGVVRGLHFQWEPPMGKLMRVARGEAFLVAVDVRKGSPTLGQWHGVTLDAESRRQLWAPAGFARGFCVTSDFAEVQYLCTSTYNPEGEGGIRWNDPALGIDWPTRGPILSEKDASAPTLEEWLSKSESDRFRYDSTKVPKYRSTEGS